MPLKKTYSNTTHVSQNITKQIKSKIQKQLKALKHKQQPKSITKVQAKQISKQYSTNPNSLNKHKQKFKTPHYTNSHKKSKLTQPKHINKLSIQHQPKIKTIQI